MRRAGAATPHPRRTQDHRDVYIAGYYAQDRPERVQPGSGQLRLGPARVRARRAVLYWEMSMPTKSISPSNTSSNGFVFLAPTRTSLALEIEPAEPVFV